MQLSELKITLLHIAIDVLDKCGLKLVPEGVLERAYRIHVPSGDMKYKSFWIRDAAMMAESGLIDIEELNDWIDFICRYGQNGSNVKNLQYGLSVPPWSIPDHINYDTGAVFYPGTYSSSDDQGNGRFGLFPPHDNAYYFIDMIYKFYIQAGMMTSQDVLSKPICGTSPLERAKKAFTAYNIDEMTDLCMSELPGFTVDWGFCDTIVKSGLLLFPSLLRMRAARQLSEMTEICGLDDDARFYHDKNKKLQQSIIQTFFTDEGWLLSATEQCRQPDVWGTVFAVWAGVLTGEKLNKTLRVLAEAYETGMVSTDGYIRHIPKGYDFSLKTSWEIAGTDHNTERHINEYQDGAYWATPTGWYAYALSLLDIDMAKRLLMEIIAHTTANQSTGAPYEWKNAEDTKISGLFYGTSGALPYAGIIRIIAEVCGA